ncbi:MAG TPA: PAS domain-containing sensor histidine kinase [Chloroflexota bacterium]|jgi:PAS domain S-box-containing protein|nr:PAS domain-containing sensor histidine kinase [Chloroflexota bacterium]
MTHAGADEDIDLRRYLRDLVALSRLPAVWVGVPRQSVIDSLADALLNTLQTHFVYARLASVSGSEPQIETVRVRGSPATRTAREVGQALEPWLQPREHVRIPVIPNPLGEGNVCLALSQIGRAGQSLGVIAAGHTRASFPTRYDLLLMNLVANHAAITLQSAQLRQVQDKLAEHQRTEEILRHSEERFRALIDHSSDIISLHQRDQSMTYVSPSATRMLGYLPTDLLGQLHTGTVHPDDLQRVGLIWSDLIERAGRVRTFRHRLKHADGSWRWVEAIATNLLHEPAVGAVVINRRDVNAEMEAHQLLEQRVVERTLQLESLFRADEMLYRSLRLDDVLQALVDVAFDILGVDQALVLMRDESDSSTERMIVRAARGFAGSGLPTLAEVLRADAASARMSVPIVARGAVLTMFNVYYARPHSFGVEEQRLFGALAQRAGLALENARLFEAARAVAALEERQKLARELHDSVSQALYAIALNASAAKEVLPIDSTRATEIVEGVLALAEAGMTEMRALIFELRPESLESEGLAGALEKQVAAMRARHHLVVQTSLNLEPDVPLPTKEALYRIAQEALHNIIKHARATHVEVSLVRQDDELRLVVADNGQGFDPLLPRPGHLGLHSMRERAAAIGAVVDIDSVTNTGTRLVARLPITRSPSESPAPQW